MNYASIKYCDIANGPGVRTSLFVSGCRVHCKGCFNAETWDFLFGSPFTTDVEQDILASLAPSYVAGLTVLGGEPFEQENQRALLPFMRDVRRLYPHKSVWFFSGYTFEVIAAGRKRCDSTDELLSLIDVLVDGPFMEEMHNVSLRFRGSTNQRIIDVRKTLSARFEAQEAGTDPSTVAPVLWRDEEVYSTHSMDHDFVGTRP